jgi:hypothetical protein
VNPAIVSLIAVIALAGAATILVLSARLRREIADLFRSFDRAERALVPLVATVRTDRDRLAARLARLTEPGDEPTRR